MQPPTGKRPPPPLTRSRLRQIAEAYVGKFGGPSANLRRVLERHVRKAHPGDGDAGLSAWRADVDAIVRDLSDAGALDDAHFARHAAERLLQRGVSPQAIGFRLQQKGLAREDVQAAVQHLGSPTDVQREAVWQLARRRRLGPFRSDAERKLHRQKDIAVLARAGHPLGLVLQVVDGAREDRG